MKEILTALMIWISANTYYNTDHPLPNVVFLPKEEMNKMYYKDNEHEPDSLHGMYDKEKDIGGKISVSRTIRFRGRRLIFFL